MSTGVRDFLRGRAGKIVGVAGALVALGFTTGFLHYWLDRAVYRLSQPAVRNAARGLLQGTRPGVADMSAPSQN